MRAALVRGPGRISWVDTVAPSASSLPPNEVIVRPLVGGICGSDLPYFTMAETFDGESPPAGSPLHEIVGVVVASEDPSLRLGAHVVGWAGRNDGLAELVQTPGSDLAEVKDFDLTHAIMAQPLACVLAAMERLAAPCRGLHVAVLGLGPIGLLFAEIASHQGARQVTGVDPLARVEDPAQFGVDTYISDTAEEWAAHVDDGEPPELVIEVVGHQRTTLGAALHAVAPWGTVYYFGVPETRSYPISMAMMLRKQLTLQAGTTARDRRRHLTSALQHLRAKPQLAQRLITDIYPVDEIESAFLHAANPAPGQGKVVLEFPR